ncbi:Thioredoxin, nucleoredoxin [Quillaja saponaria]|uniref:Thioredoxin, nucleoredoxin n=1 Tax=Quillaja saponaria TaxID=32244 RepID=A0AAD7KNG5_QUISA|nr:Thioredoxin, nucleoredoxin [Quillaja saponaria]
MQQQKKEIWLGRCSKRRKTKKWTKSTVINQLLLCDLRTPRGDSGSRRKSQLKYFDDGDTVNILDFLFTQHRDFLVKNNGDLVKANDLSGKSLTLYFLSLNCPRGREDKLTMMDMIEVYNELLPERVFEVVFVALENNDLQDDSRRGVFYGKSAEERFQYLFSGMPWPAVPYSDQQARNRLKDAFVPCKGSRPYCVILDPGGKVFKCFGGGYFFSLWGAEIFPLSHERHAHMDDEDDAVRNQLSLDLLLASPYRDFVTSSNGKKKVPISYLKNKVVGLYLSHNGSELPRIEKIKNLYRESKARGYDFEIVHITFHFCTQLSGNPKYKDVIQYSKDIPWLMVPYKDPVSRRLCRIFNIPLQDFWKGDCLVIIGPNGSFVEQYGAEIMEHFGIEAYPFTRDHVAKILSKRLKEEVRFVNMFDPEFPLVHRGGHEVAASKLWGMRVMLLFATYSECKSSKFVSMLKSKYGAQVEDDKFEVVFVPLDCEKPFLW